jgi:hypothetical protein
MKREDLQDQAGYFVGILLAFGAVVVVAYGFERLLQPQLLAGLVGISLIAVVLNWWTMSQIAKKNEGSVGSVDAQKAFFNSKKGAVFYTVGFLLFGACIVGLGFL